MSHRAMPSFDSRPHVRLMFFVRRHSATGTETESRQQNASYQSPTSMYVQVDQERAACFRSTILNSLPAPKCQDPFLPGTWKEVPPQECCPMSYLAYLPSQVQDCRRS